MCLALPRMTPWIPLRGTVGFWICFANLSAPTFYSVSFATSLREVALHTQKWTVRIYSSYRHLSLSGIFRFCWQARIPLCGTVGFWGCFASLSAPTFVGLPMYFSSKNTVLLRKEVIQPHLPIRLPCYDFTPIINPTFDCCLLSVSSQASGVIDSHGVTGGVYKARERIHRGMLIHDY